ncbi:34-kDa subunit of RNA polymerase III (C) [Phlyctochytrium planicorne]|nr:34-kDa subunit of RNA polymerase III (C) [Phlyctochytrium planicorne]
MVLTDKHRWLLEELRKFPDGATDDAIMDFYVGDKNDMVRMMNDLSDEGMVTFGSLKGTKKLVFKALDVDELERIKDLNTNQLIVYNLIKAEKAKGIWIKDIKEKSGLHTKVVNDIIKHLEKSLIKSIKSVKHPTRKLYMLAEYEPSEEITGNVFFTDQEIDVPFIEALSETIYMHILSQSFKGDPTRSEDFHPTYSGYPTALNILKFINNTKMTTVPISLVEIQMILDRLIYDDRIQKLMKFAAEDSDDSDDDSEETMTSKMYMYKAYPVRDIEDLCRVGLSSPWTDIPCGKCPVASFCTPKGPVNPEMCVYFNDWLKDPYNPPEDNIPSEMEL